MKREKIDSHAVTWSTRSNLEDARVHIRNANEATCRAILRELDKSPPEGITRRKLVETRLRKLNKEAR